MSEGTTVLIVEDEAIVAADLAGKLTRLGYGIVGTAETGEEAVALACSLAPGLVLMDIRLKGAVDGIEAAEMIRRRTDVPVVYLTAHSDAATLTRAKVTGPFGYILKPFEERELATTLEMALYKHRSDREMRDQREWLKVTLTSIGDGVATCDTEGRVTFLNPAAEALSGWTTDAARGRLIGEVFHLIDERSQGEIEDPVALVLRDREPKTLTNHIALISKDGRTIPVEDSAAPIVAGNKTILGAVLVFHDVTERRRARRALVKSEEQYRLLFTANPNPMFLFDEETLRFLAVNDAAVSHYGWSRDEFLRLSVLDIRPEEDRVNAEQIIQDHREGREVLVGTIRHRRKDGSVRDMKVTASSIVFEERPARLCLMMDVTEQKKAEEEKALLESQLTQAQKMEAIGTLAGGVAHDFNNMLSVILGYSEMIMATLNGDSGFYAHIAEIRKAAMRSADITRQLLAFARKQTISPRTLDLNDTIEGILKMLRRLVGENIDLMWTPGAELWSVRMDPSQVDQILANLIVNARDAIADTGRVLIETNNTTLDDEYCAIHAGFTPGDFVVISVSDDGHGMDRETTGKIFEPFFTTKKAGEGTGLGLATVYGIVKQNEGFINVYSEPGKGATFRVYLPRQTEPPVGAERRDDAFLAMGLGETVLVVEDEAAILSLAERFLAGLGYKVLATDRPEKALAIAAGHTGPIHLLVTDVVMPGMNGRELFEELKKNRSDLKGLFMSGYTANAIAHRGVLDKGIRFIQKPFSLRNLAAKVRGAIEHQE
jgi:PAS domain S-box-containing protein